MAAVAHGFETDWQPQVGSQDLPSRPHAEPGLKPLEKRLAKYSLIL